MSTLVKEDRCISFVHIFLCPLSFPPSVRLLQFSIATKLFLAILSPFLFIATLQSLIEELSHIRLFRYSLHPDLYIFYSIRAYSQLITIINRNSPELNGFSTWNSTISVAMYICVYVCSVCAYVIHTTHPSIIQIYYTISIHTRTYIYTHIYIHISYNIHISFSC